MSIRYFEIYQESDRDDETERYLCSNRTDAITIANSDWWSMPEYKRANIDYFCVEEFEVDDDFGERTNEVVVRTWKYTTDEDFSDLTSRNAIRTLINVANTYEDGEFDAFKAEACGENYCRSESDEVKALVKTAWEKSRAGA